MTITLKPETEEKLRKTAEWEGQDVDTLANLLLAEVLAQREQEHAEDIAAVEVAWQAVKEGRERPFSEYVAERRLNFPDPAPGAARPL